MFNVQPARPTSAAPGFGDSAIARAKAAKAATGLYVSRVLLVTGSYGDMRTFVKQADAAYRLGCQAIFQLGGFGFQSHRLEGEAYVDQVEKYALRFGIVVVWTPGEYDNVDLLARIPPDRDGLITLRSRIRCAPDGSSWTWGDAQFGTVNDIMLPGRKPKRSAMSDLDVLVVRGSLVGSDVVVSPKLRVVVYGNPAHRLVSGALPRTGEVVEWTEQTVVDLTSFSFSSDGQGSRIAMPRQADDFEVGLSYLRHYALHNEDTFVPRSYVTDDGFRLGRWIAAQRDEFDTERLDPTKAKSLEAVPYWQWDPYEPMVGSEGRLRPHRASAKGGPVLVPLSSLPKPAGLSGDRSGQTAPGRLAGPLPFPVWFERLELFVAAHGAARPSKGYVDPDGFRLGRWVSHLRDKGRRARLTADQIAALESLPGWSWSPKQDVGGGSGDPAPAAGTRPAPISGVTAAEPYRDALGGPVGVVW
jgi:Helicase associated domain